MTPEAIIAYGRNPLPVAEKGPDNAANPYFHLNLPYDYDDLSISGKRLARLNGIRLHGPNPELYKRAWTLFDTYYLRQLPNGVFYKDALPSPPAHYAAVMDLARYQLNAWAFPRGAGKSTLLGKGIPLFMSLARPNFDILMVLAKDDFVSKRFSTFMQMYEDNPYILKDFGSLKPPRGARVWNHHLLQLLNGSQLTGMPVEGKMLGERPDLILPDDPEHDKAMVANPNPQALRQSFERLLFGTIMPMLREGSCLGWIGTLLDAQSFLHHVMYSREERFQYWNRRVYGAYLEDGTEFWKEWRNKEDLERIRKLWGDDYFNTHMMNAPGGGSSTPMSIHIDYNTYTTDAGVEGDANPLQSTSPLVAVRPMRTQNPDVFVPETCLRPFGEAVSSMYRFMTIDWAFSQDNLADFSCIHVFGYENSDMFKDTLWSLDLWLDKQPAMKVTEVALRMAAKWRVKVIGSEAVGAQLGLTERLTYDFEKAYGTTAGRPQVIPIKPGNMSKDEKVANVQWRFPHFKIRLPAHRRLTMPYKELWYQITNYAIGKRRTPHDDALDTIAMCPFVVRPLRCGQNAPIGETRLLPVDKIMAGELLDKKTGLPWISAMNPRELPMEALLKAAKQTQAKQDNTQWMPA